MNPQQWSLESGYFMHEGVLSAFECQDLLASLAFAREIHRGRAGSRHLMSHREVRQVALDSRMLRIACMALGADVVPYRATLFEKSGTANWLVVWHQDTALPLNTRFDQPEWGPWSSKAGVLYAHAPSWALSHIVALRIHLDASTPNNGPLRVLPGTHRCGVLSDTDVFALGHSRTPVDCVIPRGGVMAMHPLLIHSPGKARADEPRRVLHIEYADSLALAPGIQLAIA
jgi:ectoine hydroxylase-related dioxygenase (phytanoyl-CoA dioxygenase family)